MAADGGNVNEQIVDLVTDRAIDLQRLTAQQRKDVANFLRDLEGEIVAQLAKIDPTGVSRGSYQEKRLDALLKQVKSTIIAAYRDESTRLIGELRELADIEGAFAVNSANRAIGVDMITAVVTRGQLTALVGGVLVQGSPVTEWWERQAGDTLERFTDQMRFGISQGEANGQLIRRVRGGTQNGEPVSGLFQTSRQHADSLVRAATQAVSQKARQTTYEANASLIKALMWASTIDMKTTLDCAARDRKLYTVADHKPIEHKLPWGGGPGNLHWGCRSTSAPQIRSWRELGFDINELPAGTRASMDGQIAADTSFEGWLNNRTKAQQDDYLGPGRANMWRDGGLSLRDLVDGNGRELTLEQLRKRT